MAWKACFLVIVVFCLFIDGQAQQISTLKMLTRANNDTDGGKTPSGVNNDADRGKTPSGVNNDADRGKAPSGVNSDTADGGKTPSGVNNDTADGGKTPSGVNSDTADGGKTPSGVNSDTADGGKTPSGVNSDTADRGTTPSVTPTEASSHFVIYLISGSLFVAVMYILYHNKSKISGLCQKNGPSRSKRPNVSEYQRLDQNLSEVITSLQKRNLD
ncbi:trans-Golgi network integral membrane protein 1-like isoform X4 [Chiloscyllium plagiosum]|uniref:trans-Golgi network integral membrane protein 1-like isoform X4 n=1 Tax=Chiloscyllium plagiosum TaxID=36176 RepID=UPI001CB7B9FE|nr:trans-Golgi network integral membrane protein 1-like isoform X4 [Chiloscyllium plagiosum]